MSQMRKQFSRLIYSTWQLELSNKLFDSTSRLSATMQNFHISIFFPFPFTVLILCVSTKWQSPADNTDHTLVVRFGSMSLHLLNPPRGLTMQPRGPPASASCVLRLEVYCFKHQLLIVIQPQCFHQPKKLEGKLKDTNGTHLHWLSPLQIIWMLPFPSQQTNKKTRLKTPVAQWTHPSPFWEYRPSPPVLPQTSKPPWMATSLSIKCY